MMNACAARAEYRHPLHPLVRIPDRSHSFGFPTPKEAPSGSRKPVPASRTRALPSASLCLNVTDAIGVGDDLQLNEHASLKTDDVWMCSFSAAVTLPDERTARRGSSAPDLWHATTFEDR